MTPQPLTDSQIRAAFQARSAGSASPELAERIQSAARATSQQRRLVVLPGGRAVQPQRLLWAAAISATSLALIGGLLIAGNRNDNDLSVAPSPVPSESPAAVPEPTPSAPPSEAPSPSVEPNPSGEPTPSLPAEPAVDPHLGVDTAAVTLVGDLRVRSGPTVGESSARLEPLLPAGVRLLVIEESIGADGYAWYHVIPFDPDYPTGWVAAGSREGEAWIAADETPCPAPPLDAADLSSLGVYGGLICYGDQDIEVTGSVTCDLGDFDNTVSGPSWIHDDWGCSFILDDSQYFFHPDNVPVGFPTTNVPFAVTGHFNDLQANLCEWLVDPPAPTKVELTAGCRSMFVVTDMRSPG